MSRFLSQEAENRLERLENPSRKPAPEAQGRCIHRRYPGRLTELVDRAASRRVFLCSRFKAGVMVCIPALRKVSKTDVAMTSQRVMKKHV